MKELSHHDSVSSKKKRQRPRHFGELPAHSQKSTVNNQKSLALMVIIILLLLMQCPSSQGFLQSLHRNSPQNQAALRPWSSRLQQICARKTSPYKTVSALSLSSSSSPSPPMEAFQTQFHQDMRRILDTRRDMFQRHPDRDLQKLYAPFCPWFDHDHHTTGSTPTNEEENEEQTHTTNQNRPLVLLNRRRRPPLLTHDFDGAERVHQMWGRLRTKPQSSSSSSRSSSSAASGCCTLESYLICMQAYLQRGRLRWKRQVLPPPQYPQYSTTTSPVDDRNEASSAACSGTLDDLFIVDDDDDDNDENEDDSHKSPEVDAAVPIVVCAADVIDELYQDWIQQQQEQSNPQEQPSRPIWDEAAACWLVAQAICSTPRGNRNYASRALQFIDSLRENEQSTLPVEALFYGINAAAWQQGNLQKGAWAEQADALFSELLEQLQAKEQESDQAPSSTKSMHLWGSYYPSIWTVAEMRMQAAAWTLEAWSKHGSPNSAERAQNILDQMIAWNNTSTATSLHSGQEYLYLDAEVYSNAILAWAKAGNPERAQALLIELVSLYRQDAFPDHCAEPPLIAFNSVISAWGKKKETQNAVKVLKLLQQVQQECTNLVPDTVAYNSILHSFLNSDDEAKCATWATALLKYMESNHDSQPTIKPNAFTYHTYIKCLIKGLKLVRRSSRKDASIEQNILDQIDSALIRTERLWKAGDKTVEATNRIFNMVINAYAKSNNRSASTKAFEILERMKQSKSYRPDIITMTSVMECISKSSSSDAPNQAMELLEDAMRQYEKTKKHYLMPNVRIFSMAILTLSLNQGSVGDARRLLNQLVSLYEETRHEDLKPNEYPYNYVLNCAANSHAVDKHDQEHNFRMATQTYKEMRESPYVKPDSFTYGFWLKCCNNLLDDMELRSKCVLYALNECKQQGLLTDEILTRLYQGSPPALVNEFLELDEGTNYRVGSLRIKDLPREWSRSTSRLISRRG